MPDEDYLVLVLVIEDDAALRRLIRKRLNDEGWTVAAFQTMAEGCEYLKQSHADLVILDWTLPDGDGSQLLDVLQHKPQAMLPSVITISGELPDLGSLEALPNSRFIAKPFDIRVLVRHARRAVQQVSGGGLRYATRDENDRVAAQVRTLLGANAALRGEPPIWADVSDGVATLHGQVDSSELRALAARSALRVPGVRTVINRIQVMQPVNASGITERAAGRES